MFLMRFTERAYVNYTAEDVKNSINSAVRLTFSNTHFGTFQIPVGSFRETSGDTRAVAKKTVNYFWPVLKGAENSYTRRRPRLTGSLSQKRQQFSIDLVWRLPLEKVSVMPQMLRPGIGEYRPPDVLQRARTHGFSRPHPAGAKQK